MAIDLVAELARLKFYKLESKFAKGRIDKDEYKWLVMENLGEKENRPIAQFKGEKDCDLFLAAKRAAFVEENKATPK